MPRSRPQVTSKRRTRSKSTKAPKRYARSKHFSKHPIAAIAAFALVTVRGAQYPHQGHCDDHKSEEAAPWEHPGYVPGVAPHAHPMVGQPGQLVQAIEEQEEQKTPGPPNAPHNYHRRGRSPPGAPRGPSRRRTRSPSPARTWDCSRCTFINKADQSKCEMCRTPSSMTEDRTRATTREELLNSWLEGKTIDDDTPVWFWVKTKDRHSQDRIYDNAAAEIIESCYTSRNPECEIIQNTSKATGAKYTVTMSYGSHFRAFQSRPGGGSDYPVKRKTFGALSLQNKLQFILVKIKGVPVWEYMENFSHFDIRGNRKPIVTELTHKNWERVRQMLEK